MTGRMFILSDGTPTAELEEGEMLSIHNIFGDVYDAVKDKAGGAYDYAKDKAGGAYDYAKDKLGGAYDYAKDKTGAGSAYDYAKDKAGGAYDWAKDELGLGGGGGGAPPAVSYDALSANCSAHKGVKQISKDPKTGAFQVLCKDDQIFLVQPNGSSQDMGNASGFGDVGSKSISNDSVAKIKSNDSTDSKADEGISSGAMVGITLGVLAVTGVVVWGLTHRG